MRTLGSQTTLRVSQFARSASNAAGSSLMASSTTTKATGRASSAGVRSFKDGAGSSEVLTESSAD